MSGLWFGKIEKRWRQMAVRDAARVGFNCQLDVRVAWEESLSEGLSAMGWTVGNVHVEMYHLS